MHMVMVCDRMGWDYDTYMRQPVWFLQLLDIKLEEDAKGKKPKGSRSKLST